MTQLKDFIKKLGLNPCQVSKELGVAPSTITRHLEGSRGMSLSTAIKYNKLGVPWDVLVNSELSKSSKRKD